MTCRRCRMSDRIRRLHCSGGNADCKRVGCHLAVICERCDYEWVERCPDHGEAVA